MPPTLIDTSVLARLLERDSPKGVAAARLLQEVGSLSLGVCAQVLIEFWVVATRPLELNGYGLEPDDANKCIADLLSSFALLSDPPDLFERWRDLVSTHGVRGKQAHDAKLVALLRAHGGKCVLTFNPRDFRRYSDLELLTPETQ